LVFNFFYKGRVVMNRSIRWGASLVVFVVLGLSGCASMMAGMAGVFGQSNPKAVAGQDAEFDKLAAFRKEAIGRMDAKKDDKAGGGYVLSPAQCRLQDGAWKRGLPASFVYLGACDDAGLATGYGMVMLPVVLQPTQAPGAPAGSMVAPTLLQYHFLSLRKGADDKPVVQTYEAFYIGDFAAGKPHGQGQLSMPVAGRVAAVRAAGKMKVSEPVAGAAGAPEASQLSAVLWIPKYLGEFADGVMQGEGVLFSANGLLEYAGQFANGNKTGAGKAYLPKFYELEAVIEHGVAQSLYPIVQKGNFVNGRLDGVGLVTMSQCKTVTANFRSGQLVAGAGTVFVPTTSDQQASKSGAMRYAYGGEKTAFMNTDYSLTDKGFVSVQGQDDHAFFTVTGVYSQTGKREGDFLVTKAVKGVAAHTNATSRKLAVDEVEGKVYKVRETYKNGVKVSQKDVTDEDESTLSKLGTAAAYANVLTGGAAVSQFTAYKAAGMKLLAMGRSMQSDPCSPIDSSASDIEKRHDASVAALATANETNQRLRIR
jgi:hypothetical protein